MKRCLFFLCILLGSSSFIAAQTAAHARRPFEKTKVNAASGTPVILYHGGPVLVAAKDLYAIYYGSFTSTQHAILDNFLQNLGGSGAYNVNSEYTNGSGQSVSNILSYSPNTDSFDDAYSLGTSLSGSFEVTIIHNAIANGRLPNDVNGIYILTVSPDVKLPKSVWCAFHTSPPTSLRARTFGMHLLPIRRRPFTGAVRETSPTLAIPPVRMGTSAWTRSPTI